MGLQYVRVHGGDDVVEQVRLRVEQLTEILLVQEERHLLPICDICILYVGIKGGALPGFLTFMGLKS